MAGTECRTNAISNQHTLSVCTASGKISCGWSHQQPAFLSATQCLKEAWEVKRACEVARLAYAGMAVRCKGRSGSGAVDRQSGAREGAAAIHLMFCFVGATGNGVQRGAAGCSIGAAGVASTMSTAWHAQNTRSLSGMKNTTRALENLRVPPPARRVGHAGAASPQRPRPPGAGFRNSGAPSSSCAQKCMRSRLLAIGERRPLHPSGYRL